MCRCPSRAWPDRAVGARRSRSGSCTSTRSRRGGRRRCGSREPPTATRSGGAPRRSRCISCVGSWNRIGTVRCERPGYRGRRCTDARLRRLSRSHSGGKRTRGVGCRSARDRRRTARAGVEPPPHRRVPRLGGAAGCGARGGGGARRSRGRPAASLRHEGVPRDARGRDGRPARRDRCRNDARGARAGTSGDPQPVHARTPSVASARHRRALEGTSDPCANICSCDGDRSVRDCCLPVCPARRRSAVRRSRVRRARRLNYVDRDQALETVLGQIERNFGKGAVMRMSDGADVTIGAVSTGSLALDLALGIGGLPRGRIVEVFGPESSGKTTLVYHVIAEAQRRGGVCAFIDAEHAMDPAYAKKIGVNIDELLVSQPDTGEQALEIAELLIRSGALDVVAIDSVAALTPKAEIEGEMGDSHVGLQARLMSQALRKLAGTLNRTDTICLFTNQLREKIGVMFGSPETTPGGRALKFYASIRLDIRRIETLKEGVEAIGNRIRVKVVKNKVAPPFKQAEFDIIYGSGISWEGTVIDVGVERKVVTKSGSYFSFGDERLGQGRQNATAFLREHPDVMQQILQQIQLDVGPEQIVSARLLPVAAAEPASETNGAPAGKAAKAAAAAAAIASVDGGDE